MIDGGLQGIDAWHFGRHLVLDKHIQEKGVSQLPRKFSVKNE